MIQSCKNYLSNLSLPTFSMRPIQNKWNTWKRPVTYRDVTIQEIALGALGLITVLTAYKLVRYAFSATRTLTLTDGNTLKVEFKEGQAQGIITKQGQLQGKGTKKFPNGDIHTGKFERGELVKGTITFANGEVWSGKFKAGKLEGCGKQDFSSRTPVEDNQIMIKEGTFADGLLENGIIQFKGGYAYEGNFKQEKLVEGRIVGSDGSTITGKFDKDLNLQGKGKKCHPETSPLLKEAGMFRNNLLHGVGKRIFRMGQIQEGIFNAGYFVHGTISCEDGMILYGTYDHQLRLHGNGLSISEGIMYLGTFSQGDPVQGQRIGINGAITQVGGVKTT